MTARVSKGRIEIRPFSRSLSAHHGFRTAVSLHAHTHHSKEVLIHVEDRIRRFPVASAVYQRESRAYATRHGEPPDFSKGWWSPPLSPMEVYQSEARHIREHFGIAALISITDHDTVSAADELRPHHPRERAPLSLEWSVPFESAIFHVGVHNLPDDPELLDALADYTRTASPSRLATLLADLDADRRILVVLNHPLWDLASLGKRAHAHVLSRFLSEHGHRLHALEVNGYRTWRENLAVGSIAQDRGLAVVSGGDRHGRAPNAIVNLTNAATFDDFVHEVRTEATSQMVTMPVYGRRLVARRLAVAADVLRASSDGTTRRSWTDRVSCESDGAVTSLSCVWPDGGPFWVRTAVRVFHLLTSRPMMPLVGRCLPGDGRQISTYETWQDVRERRSVGAVREREYLPRAG